MLMTICSRVRTVFHETFMPGPDECPECGGSDLRVVGAIPDDNHPRAEVLRCESCGECRETEV